jgi:hypothetical protein
MKEACRGARAGRRHRRYGGIIGKIDEVFMQKIAWRFDGGEDICGVYIRCSLRFC